MSRTSRNYNTETIERALWMLALQANSPEQASKALAAQGIKISRQTIHRWANEDPERYAKVQKEASDQIADRIAAEAEAFMVQAARVEAKALTALEAQIDAGQVKDIGSALRNLTTSKALNNDKVASPLRGRATAVVKHDRTGDEALKRLQASHPSLFIDSTATEIQDAQEALPPASS